MIYWIKDKWISFRRWRNSRRFQQNRKQFRNVAAWAVHHHANGGSHDADSIRSGSADKRIMQAMGEEAK